MREGQKELRKMIDTKKAFKFKHGTTKEKTFPIQPGKNPKKQHKGLVEESKPQKKFKKGKELRENKMGGGMMGRRFGMKKGTPNPFKKETNVEKIKKTFGTKKGLGMQSIIYGLDKNPKITAADPKAKFIAAANKKKKV